MKKKISIENFGVIESIKTIIAKKNNSKKGTDLLLKNWQNKVGNKYVKPVLSENCN